MCRALRDGGGSGDLLYTSGEVGKQAVLHFRAEVVELAEISRDLTGALTVASCVLARHLRVGHHGNWKFKKKS